MFCLLRSDYVEALWLDGCVHVCFFVFLVVHVFFFFCCFVCILSPIVCVSAIWYSTLFLFCVAVLVLLLVLMNDDILEKK